MTQETDMQGIDANRAAIEAMLRAAVGEVEGVAFHSLEIKPCRGTTQVRANARFTGTDDIDATVELSEAIGDRIAAGFGATWPFADRIEFQRAPGGFTLSIGFDSAPAATVEVYRWPTGHTMRREDGVSPAGNPFTGCWTLRDPAGTFVDHDRYRHDIIPRHGLADIEPELEPA